MGIIFPYIVRVLGVKYLFSVRFVKSEQEEGVFARLERMNRMKTIMIVDDDIYIGDLLEELLTKEGYGVCRAYSGTEALLLLSGSKPDLILLDLMLPGLVGEEVLPQIQGIPVIVVSACADVQGKVDLLMGGAVDYITKPFDTRELLARIMVQFRQGTSKKDSGILSHDGIVMNTASYQVFIGEQEVRLTKTEYAILRLFLRNPTQVLAKSVILERIKEDTPDCVESSLKVHMSNLRRKLRESGEKDYIESVWGIGFKWAESKS